MAGRQYLLRKGAGYRPEERRSVSRQADGRIAGKKPQTVSRLRRAL